MTVRVSDLIDPDRERELRALTGQAPAADSSGPSEDEVKADVPAGLEHKADPANGGAQVLSADDQTGVVEALVSVTGVEDRVKDIIEPGAYTKTLAEREPIGVWSHDDKTWVARTEEARELLPGDPFLKGLTTMDGKPWDPRAGAVYVKARFNLDTPHGKAAYSDVKFFQGKTGWSIGYRATKAHRNPRTGVRHIKELDWFEFSPVMVGAASQPMTLAVKSLHGATGVADEVLDTLTAEELDRFHDIKAAVGLEVKDRVRTREGQERFGQPIGSVIVPDGVKGDISDDDLAQMARAAVAKGDRAEVEQLKKAARLKPSERRAALTSGRLGGDKPAKPAADKPAKPAAERFSERGDTFQDGDSLWEYDEGKRRWFESTPEGRDATQEGRTDTQMREEFGSRFDGAQSGTQGGAVQAAATADRAGGGTPAENVGALIDQMRTDGKDDDVTDELQGLLNLFKMRDADTEDAEDLADALERVKGFEDGDRLDAVVQQLRAWKPKAGKKSAEAVAVRAKLGALNTRRAARGQHPLDGLPAEAKHLHLDVLDLMDDDFLDVKGSSASLNRSPKVNWVEKAGDLPAYVREVARSIEKTGRSLDEAIPIAIGRIKRWARGGGDVKPDTVAKAQKAVAEWEALKAKAGKKYDSDLLAHIEQKTLDHLAAVDAAYAFLYEAGEFKDFEPVEGGDEPEPVVETDADLFDGDPADSVEAAEEKSYDLVDMLRRGRELKALLDD